MRAWFWIGISAALLATSYAASSSALTGGWEVHVLGVEHGSIWDPGGPYFGGGVLLFHQPYAPFVGHPGLTLMLLCHLVAKAVYLPFSSDMAFDAFVARYLYWVIAASMLSITGVFLLVLAVIERLALRVLGEPRLAILAVVAYATTFPVLYYLNKISTEPLLVLFTLLAFLWLWRYYELRGQRLAMVFLALSAQAAVAAIYTKVLIVAPIALFIPAQIVFYGGAPVRRRIRDGGLYVMFCVPGLLLGALKTDWAYFVQFWFAYAPGAPRYSGSSNWLENLLVNAPTTVLAMLGSALSQLAPWRLVLSFETREGLFFASEGLFLLLSAAGLVMYLRACRNRPVLLLWFLAFLGLTAVPYLQKGLSAWHYLFIHFAVASIFVSYAIARLARTLIGANVATLRGWLLCCCAVLAVNSIGLYLFIDMRRYDARQNRSWELYYRAPSMVGPGSRIGLLHAAHIDEIMQPVSAYLPITGFLEEFRGFFVPISGDEGNAVLKRRGIEALVEVTPAGLVFRRVD